MHAEALSADGPTVHDGRLRGLAGFRPEDIDPGTGNPRPGAVKVQYVYDHPVDDGSTVRGAWSLRMIVLSREPESDHARWKDASKAQLVAQCNTYADFKFEKTMLQWIAFSKGHSVVYGVRFHCECAPVEALWAYIVHLLRQKLDGTPATLLALLAEFLAWAVKPDVSARLFNRPTECTLLYTLGVVSPGSVLEAGLSAPQVVDLQRAFSGYSNRPRREIGAAHPRASVAGCNADASLEAVDLDANLCALEEDEGGEFDEGGAAAPPRAVEAPPPRAAAPGGVAGGAAAAAALAGPLLHSPVPGEVPHNLWELLSCIKEQARRDITDRRKKVPAIWAAFLVVVQRVWNTESGRAVLHVLKTKNPADITPAFALENSIVLYLGVRAGLPCEAGPVQVLAALTCADYKNAISVGRTDYVQMYGIAYRRSGFQFRSTEHVKHLQEAARLFTAPLALPTAPIADVFSPLR